jgi:hypothetical protein
MEVSVTYQSFDPTDLIVAMLTGAEAVAWKYLDMAMVGRNVGFVCCLGNQSNRVVSMWLCSHDRKYPF